jgi:hypothetical protein
MIRFSTWGRQALHLVCVGLRGADVLTCGLALAIGCNHPSIHHESVSTARLIAHVTRPCGPDVVPRYLRGLE